jgi:hypothetical protein
MASPPSLPAAPSPQEMGQEQEQVNTQTAATQQGANMVNNASPYGSLTYQTSINPTTGLPEYSANTTLSPQQQGLLGESQTTGLIQGGAGANLAEQMFPTYSSAPNFTQGATSLTSQAEAPNIQAFSQFFVPQQQQLETQLSNSGIPPVNQDGSPNPAYWQQMGQLQQTQLNTEGQWLANFQPTAFNEAVTQYQAPEQMISSLFGMGQPTSLPGTFTSTPQVALQAPNMNQANQVSLAQQDYNQQQQTMFQNNLMGGLFGLGGNAAMMYMLAGGLGA